MSIHSRDDAVILEFGLHKPAYRICVNTSTTHGSVGMTTGLDPAMTLGCGGFGGNITSDNISPKHLLNIKRLAYELRPLAHQTVAPGAAAVSAAPVEPLKLRVDRFLKGKGFGSTPAAPTRVEPAKVTASPPQPVDKPVPFVCEDDVRQALKAGRTILISDRTIVTPAARDLGEAERVFRTAGVNTLQQ